MTIEDDSLKSKTNYKVFRVISYTPLPLVRFLKEKDILFLFRRTVLEYYFKTFGYIGSVITIDKKFIPCGKNYSFIIQTMILNPDPKFRISSRTHVPRSQGVLLIFDKKTLHEEEKYYEILERFMKFYEGKRFPVLLVLINNKVSSEDIRQLDNLTSRLKKRINIANSAYEPLFFKAVLERSQEQIKNQLLSFISNVFCKFAFNSEG